MSAVRRAPAFALLAALAASLVAHAQPDPKAAPKAAEVTADDVKAAAERFKAERDEAVKAKFPPEALARADDLVKRAEAAAKAENLKIAARFYRDARWQLPFLPASLPPNVLRVFGESRLRHADRVNAVAYSPDGTKLASASRDNTVRVWDLGNGRELAAYRGHAAAAPADTTKDANVFKVADVAFHPEGKMVASAAGSQVHLWNPADGKQIKVLVTLEKADKPLKSIAFSRDGKHLAAGGDDGILRVFETETGKNTFTGTPRNVRIERVAFSPNGKLVGIADSGGQVAVYAPGAANVMPMSTGVIDQGSAFGVAFSADGAAVFTCGSDGKARLTAGPAPDGGGAGNTATKLREFLGHTGSINALALTLDGKALVTGGDDRTVRVWDATSGKQLRSFQGHMQKVTALAVRGDGRQIASASDDGAIRLWDLSTSDDHRALTDAAEPVWAVAISPDGKRLAAGGADKTIRVYDPETGKLAATLSGHTAAVTSVAFFPDNGRLLSAGGDRVAKVWDVANQKAVGELKGHDLPLLGVALSGDGKLAVTGAADKTARGWEPESGKQLWLWTGKSAVCTVAVRKDGKTVAVGTADGNLVVLDVSSGSPKEVAPAVSAHVAGVAWAAFSPDGTKLATVGGDGAARIWTVTESGAITPLAKFDGQPKPGTSSGFYPLSGVAFSPDGRFIATAGADTVVRVWDIQTKAEVRGLRAHADWAVAVAFSPDGRLLASAGADKTARIFELTPQETSTAAGHLLAVNAIAVSPDGKLVATAAVDQTIKLWELASGREVGTLIGNADRPYAVTFLGNDGVVMGGASAEQTGRAHFWAIKPARLVRSLQLGEVYTVAALPDGSKVGIWSVRSTLGDKPVKASVYELYDADGKALATLNDQGREVRAASFSADLSQVAAGDDAGAVRIWDAAKKERVGGDWALFANAVGDLGLTPDKKRLVGIDAKGLVKVADVAKRETLYSGTAHAGNVRALLVSPKGDTFLTVGGDREVKLWSLADDAKELKELRSWKLPAGVNGAAYTPDGRTAVTANADGTAYVLELP